MKKIFAVLKLVRFEHGIMFALAVLIAELITAKGALLFSPVIFFSLLIPLFSEMGAFALNDLVDVESDRINKKIERPLVSGMLSLQFAKNLAIGSFLLALIFACFVSPFILIFTAGINLLAILYNFKLKDLPLAGNIYIGFTMAVPFIFGNYIISDVLDPVNVFIACSAFLVGLGREIIKSIEDMKGDKKARKSKTLPIIIGSEKSLKLSGFLYLCFIILSFALYYFYLEIGAGFFLVLISNCAFFYCAFTHIFLKQKNQFLKTSRKISLIALFIALIGILLSVVGS